MHPTTSFPSYLTGEQCRCGTWVTPAFQIQTSKVDLSRHVSRNQPITNMRHQRTWNLEKPANENNDSSGCGVIDDKVVTQISNDLSKIVT